MAIKNIKGLRSGMLEALEFAYVDDKRHAVWRCRCDCGNICEVRSMSLLAGDTKSCGCMRVKKSAECVICGNPIPADSKYKYFCGDNCKKISSNINQVRFQSKRKKAKNKKSGLTPLDKILQELKEYNIKHNTNLSYGQYVHLIDNKKSSPA